MIKKKVTITELESYYREAKALIEKEEKRRRKSPEELEIEYSNLKAIFALLETDDFKYADFSNIFYIHREEEKEIEIFSERHRVHKIVRNEDFQAKFRTSAWGFIDFLHDNGAVNELKPKKRSLKLMNAATEAMTPQGPKVGKVLRRELRTHT